MNNYKIDMKDLEKIIDEALQYGIRAGEMRAMDSGNYREYLEKCRVFIISNAKTLMLEQYRKEDSKYEHEGMKYSSTNPAQKENNE